MNPSDMEEIPLASPSVSDSFWQNHLLLDEDLYPCLSLPHLALIPQPDSLALSTPRRICQDNLFPTVHADDSPIFAQTNPARDAPIPSPSPVMEPFILDQEVPRTDTSTSAESDKPAEPQRSSEEHPQLHRKTETDSPTPSTPAPTPLSPSPSETSKISIKKRRSPSNSTRIVRKTEPKAVKLIACPEPSCTKTFKRRYNLKVHSRVHTGEMPYRCPRQTEGCEERFRWRSTLRYHLLTIHGEKVGGTGQPRKRAAGRVEEEGSGKLGKGKGAQKRAAKEVMGEEENVQGEEDPAVLGQKKRKKRKVKSESGLKTKQTESSTTPSGHLTASRVEPVRNDAINEITWLPQHIGGEEAALAPADLVVAPMAEDMGRQTRQDDGNGKAVEHRPGAQDVDGGGGDRADNMFAVDRTAFEVAAAPDVDALDEEGFNIVKLMNQDEDMQLADLDSTFLAEVEDLCALGEDALAGL